MVCNLFTGVGFADLSILGAFSMAWLGLVMLFFINVFARKWLAEEFDLPYNIIGGYIGAFLPYIIAVTITCSPKWALAAGLIGWLVGSFGSGFFFPDGGGSDY